MLEITIETVLHPGPELEGEIRAIDAGAFGPENLNPWIWPVFLHYGRIYLARLDGVSVGVAELIRNWQEPSKAFLYGLAVADPYRDRGVGTALLRRMLEDLPADGIHRLELTVHPENMKALHLYCDKFGMKPLGLLKDYYGPGEDRWLLEWKGD